MHKSQEILKHLVHTKPNFTRVIFLIGDADRIVSKMRTTHQNFHKTETFYTVLQKAII